MCKVIVVRNGSVNLIVKWWSATIDALEGKQSFPGKFSLGIYLDNIEYKPINGQSSQKIKFYRPDLAFSVVRVMIVDIMVCATGSRWGQIVYIGT